MKISVLTPDVSQNCLGRSYLLAQLLQKYYEVEIIGPMFGEDIWEPVRTLKKVNIKYIKINKFPRSLFDMKRLIRLISGDIIYCSKPLFFSFGIGLLIKTFNHKPLILDIDDWEFGFVKELHKYISKKNFLLYLIKSTLYFYENQSYWNSYVFEKLYKIANYITVSNTFLQKKFGGIIIPHVRDTNFLDPTKINGELVRRKLNISKDKKIVMFFGTPRPYKGLTNLIEAVELIKDNNILLVIVGVDYENKYSQSVIKYAKSHLKDRFIDFGFQPFNRVPDFLAIADVVVIPQKNNSATLGQIPAKVFDAMAMAKPIITTNVSDMQIILEDCAWIIDDPDDTGKLSYIIEYVFKNPEEAKLKGLKARNRCNIMYSFSATSKLLSELIDNTYK
ncbi:glycosyltransferase [Pelotomaculum propionicicum]|uniref:glycosyltransferase n=1 Tax=Pelotomaculum propionicicum TaxID=258475 RepID=UPI003B8070A1